MTDPKNAAWAKALSAREGAQKLDLDPFWDRPKESNGGSGRLPAPAKPAADKKAAEGKEPPKKGGEAEKKEPEKK